MKKFVLISLFFLFFISIYSQTIVLKGGTIIDVGNWGDAHDDISNSVVFIKDGMITHVGTEKKIMIPKNARVIDIRGKYLVPGLVDGFATLNNQAYADAYLYMGITSIIAVEGGRRGRLFTKAFPGPHLFRLESVGEEKISTTKMLGQIEKLYKNGYKVVLLMYQLTPEQFSIAVKRAHELGLGAIGELGICDYMKAIKTGVDAFVHTTRYCLGMAPEMMRLAVANHPFSDNLNSAKWQYYKWLTQADLSQKHIRYYQKKIASSHVALLPTLSLLYLDLPKHENPWKERVADILNPVDINKPADKNTGNHRYDSAHDNAYRALALKEYEIEKQFKMYGARYLAGSATDVWGTMPGISLHWELGSLKKIGLTSRGVIAAASGNFNLVFGWKVGLVKKGFKADLLVLNGNPLQDLKNLKNISILMKDGVIIDREKLLERHKQ